MTVPFDKRPGVTEAQMALAILPPVPIETERLRLRFHVAEDLAPLLALQSREDVTRWLYWSPRSEPEVRESLALKVAATRIAADGDAVHARDRAQGLGRLRGRRRPVGDQPRAPLRASSASSCTRTTRAAATPPRRPRPLLELGFTCFGMRRIVGRTEARNAASARVLEKLGMRREAHLVENEWVKGEWQSELGYALLEAEWRAAQSQPRRRK